MSDKPREWPNVAKAARDLAAEAAQKGIMKMEPILFGERAMTETERLRGEAIVLNCLQRITRALESVGAPTRVNYE